VTAPTGLAEPEIGTVIDPQALAARLFGGPDRSRSRGETRRPRSRVPAARRRFLAELSRLEERCLLSGEVYVPAGSDRPLKTIFWNGGGPTDPARKPPHFVEGINTPPTEKTITITNVSDQMIYPLLQGVNTGRLVSAATPQNPDGYYDPQDNHNEEFRAYIGFMDTQNMQQLGLPPHATITFRVPLVFWDSERTYIVTDGTDLIPEPANLERQNPFHYDPTSLRGVSLSTQPDSWVKSLTINGAASTGLVMFYHAQRSQGIAPDAPAQLTEFTIRDPYLTHWLHEDPEHIAETTVEFNYDVSYVDNLTAPVAMEAADVPVPIPFQADPPRAHYGWAGSDLIYNSATQRNMHDLVRDFINNTGAASIGQYFGGKGWPDYFNPNGILNIPSGANIFANSPLAAVVSSYATYGANNQWMLTSGGIGPILVQHGGAVKDSKTLRLDYAKDQLDKREVDYATLKSWLDDKQVVSAKTLAAQVGTVLSVVKDDSDPNLKSLLLTLQDATSLTGNQSFIFSKPATDYATTTITNLWYAWANYYLDQFKSAKPPASVPRGSIAPNTNLLAFSGRPPAGLSLGMSVRGPGIDPAAGTRSIILDIDYNQTKNQTVVHLSQLSKPGGAGKYDFGLPQPLPFANQDGIESVTVLTGGSGFTPQSRFPVKIVGGGGTGATAIAVVGDDGKVTDVAITSSGTGYTSTPTLDFSDGGGTGVTATVALGSFVNPPVLTFPTDQLDKARLFAGSVYTAMAAESMIPGFTVKSPKLPAPMSLVYTTIGADILHLPNSNDGKSQVGADVRDLIKSILRGVPDFKKAPESEWYPNPATWQGGLKYNAYNLDPYVWFVHVVLGFSGYGFSVDDDTSDVGAYASNYTPQFQRVYPNHIDVVFSGLRDPNTQQGVQNTAKWYSNVQWGPVQTRGTISNPQPGRTIITLARSEQIKYWQIAVPDQTVIGALVVGKGIPAGTRVAGQGDIDQLVLILSNFVPNSNGDIDLLFTGAAPKALVQDLDFENPLLTQSPPNNHAEDPAGSAWDFSKDAGIAGNGSALTAHNGPAPQGTQVLYLANRGKIRRKLTLPRGRYVLTFSAARRRQEDASLDRQAIRVLVDGKLVRRVRPSGSDYTAYSVPFRVPAGKHTITLAGTDGPGNNMVFLDAIDLRARPATNSLARLARLT
jgi:hypothetical protein